MPNRRELEELLHRVVPDAETRSLGLNLRNRGQVEKVVVGPASASGRVRGKRRDAGFNVRVAFDTGKYSCGCPISRTRACEHVAAFLIAAASLVPADASEGDAAVVKQKQALEPDPEVYRFLVDLFPGIGPRRAREVARVFRSVPDLLGATERQLRELPEIGEWAASALRERLVAYTRLGPAGALSATPQEKPTRRPLTEKVDVDERVAAFAADVGEDDQRSRILSDVRLLVQATRAGPVFFRSEPANEPHFRYMMKRLTEQDPGVARASPRRVWVSGPEEFPRIVGRLEALGCERESARLVDLPLDGLAVFYDPSGRRARFQAATDGADAAFPLFVDTLKGAEGYEFDDINNHHLVLPKEFPRLRAYFTDAGALLVRRRLRPLREYTEWKEPSEEEWSPGTPKRHPIPPFDQYLAQGPPEGIRAEIQLYPYQREGVAFIRATDYVAYLGDQPGLGKTLQAITAALYLPGRVLVVCPAGARSVWKKEIAGATTVECFVLLPSQSGRKATSAMKDAKFVVASYDSLLSQRDLLMSLDYDLVILDEAHYVKNKDAERTKIVHDALRSIPRRLLLSGTPVMNRPEEARKQLEFLYPDEWGNESWFRARFVNPLQAGTPAVRKLALSSLRGYFEGVMLRRRKTDVLKDLPPRHTLIERVRLSPTWRREYEAEAELLREHVRVNRDTAFGEAYEITRGHIMTLRQIASNAKGEAAEAHARKLLSAPGEKVVIFSVYLAHLEALQKSLAEFNCVTVHGGVVDKDRASAVKRFQEDPECRVFLGQLVAAGTALTLTAARHVIFVDLDWNPANHEQAGDRVHRISQTRDVFLHYLVAGNTIEEDIVKLLDMKSQDTALLLDGDEEALGLLAQRRQNRMVAELALKASMATPEAAPAA